MKKLSLSALMALAVALSAGAQDYCTYSGTSQSVRHTRFITVSAPSGETSLSSLQTGSGSAIYFDNTETVITAKPGDAITFTPGTVGGHGWMHNYLYVDYDNDKVFTPMLDDENHKVAEGSELVDFCFYDWGQDNGSGWNSKGETMAHSVNGYTTPLSFTVPADLADGDYRIRYKCDWNDIDPCATHADGLNTLTANGGIMVDLTLRLGDGGQGGGEPANELATVFTNRLNEIEGYLNLYMVNQPTSQEAITHYLSLVDQYKQYASQIIVNMTSEEEVITFADNQILNPVENAIVSELNSMADTTIWEFNNAVRAANGKPSYFSSTVVNNNQRKYTGQTATGISTLWTLTGSGQFSMYAMSNGLKLFASSNASSNAQLSWNYGSAVRQDVYLKFAVKEGYLKLIAPRTANGNCVFGFLDTEEYNCVRVVDESNVEILWTAKAVSAADAKARFAETITGWGNSVPGGAKLSETYVEQIYAVDATAAADLTARLSAIATEANTALTALLSQSVGKDLTLQNVANGGYLYKDLGWSTTATFNEDCVWNLEPTGTEGQYYLYNYEADNYINSSMGTTSEKSAAQAFVINLNSKGSIELIPANNNLNAVYYNGKKLVSDLNNGLNTPGMQWRLALAPNPDQEMLDAMQAQIDELLALAELYKQSIPFSEILDDVIYTLKSMNPADYLDQAEWFGMIIAEQKTMVEDMLVEELYFNTKQPWYIYQPDQRGYLSNNTVSKNRNGGVYNVFNYQTEKNSEAIWTLVPSEENSRQFRLKSNSGLWMLTPEKWYVNSSNVQPTGNDGLFEFQVRDGYVVFASVAFPGCALSFDLQNDPVEIYNIGSNGDRWQVSLVEPAAVPLVVTPAAGEVAADLLSNITIQIDSEEAAGAELVVTDNITVTTPVEIYNAVEFESVTDWYGNTVIKIDLSRYGEIIKGDYVMEIPEKFITSELFYTEATTVTWTVTTTGIENITINGVPAGEAYDLQGRRVSNPANGQIYVIDGKKVRVSNK